MDDEIRQFAVSALKDMNYDVSEVTGETDLGPAGLDLDELTAEVAGRLAVTAGSGGE
ncbi:MAG TPA: hypothetical protein VGG25_14060 [Streptosporangiaceae bacterium]|jgi:acyl carrier protein